MLHVEAQDATAVVRLEHGPVNALDLDLVRGITSTMQELGESGHAVVITGSGRSFSAGVDLRAVIEGGPAYVREFLPALTDAFLAVFDHPRPTVAAVNGHAIAGGFVIAAACDRRVAADTDGQLGLTELAVGVPFPISAIEIVRHAVGTQVAARLALGTELVGVSAAQETGIVDEVVEPERLLEAARSELAELARLPSEAYALTATQLKRPTRARIEAHDHEDAQVIEMWSRPESLRAIRRFLDGVRS